MDFKPGKQGISNAEVREYALATMQKPSSSLGTVVAVLAILIPATGVYLWRTGTLNGALSSFGQSLPAMPSASGGAGAAASGAFASAGGKPDLRDPTQAYAMALTMQMNMDVIMEYIGEEMEGSFASMSNEPKRWISPDRLVDHCKQIARMQVADRGRAYSKNGASMFNLMGERVHCLLTKRPDKLCDPATKEEVVRQYGMYHKVKHGAFDVLMGNSDAKSAAMLNVGLHGSIKTELRKLGERGYLQASDFGWFKPADIKEVFADIKNVKPFCGA